MQAALHGQIGDFEPVGLVERADDAPLLIGHAMRIEMRTEARHHDLARAHQLHRQRTVEWAHAVAHTPSATRLRSVPISGTAISTTSPGTSQRGGSKRAPAPVGVPVTIRSPGLSVVKVVM